MAPTCFPQDIVQKTGHHHRVWLSMLTLSYFIAVTACKEPIQLRGHVGREVAFNCSAKQHQELKWLYLQKKNVYVNGYYELKDMGQIPAWPNSRVDRHQNVIYMSELNISHSGLYTCHIGYNDSSSEEKNIELIMTANYSKPSVYPQNCSDKTGQCLVLCSSHGGYPKDEIIWNVTALEGPPSAMMRSNESITEDNNTLLLNISSMASFNCSTETQQNIRCSVGGVSTVLSICQQENAPEKRTNSIVIAAVCALFFIIILVFCYKYKNEIKQFIRNRCGTNTEANTVI